MSNQEVTTSEFATGSLENTAMEAEFVGADAYMSISNNWATSQTAIVTENTKMSDTFPSPTVISTGETRPDPPAHISVSWKPGQSGFNFNIAGSAFEIKLGTFPRVTSASITGPPGQAEAVLAPINPLTTKTDYNFVFLTGPGLLQNFVNSFFDANWTALGEYVLKNPQKIKISDKITCIIKDIRNPAPPKCAYAAISQSSDHIWNLDIVIGFTGSISGDTIIGDFSPDFGLAVEDLKVVAQVVVDLTNPDKIKAEVIMLQFSANKTSWSGAIVDLIGIIPVYDQIGFLNTTVNSNIIQIIQKLLDQILTGAAPGVSTAQVSPPYPTPQHTDHSQWMSDPSLQSKNLSDIKLPATHDSGTYELSNELSQIQYPDIAFLWKLDPNSAPADGTNPFDISNDRKLHLGSSLYEYVISQIKGVAQAHDSDLSQQCQDGIRYFDLRVYYDTRYSDFYLQHGLRGPLLSDALQGVRKFLDSNSSSHEIVFLNLSHANFNKTSPYPAQLAKKLEAIFAGYIYIPQDAIGVSDYDFSKITSLKLSQIASNGPKVVLINGDGDEYTYQRAVINTSGFPSTKQMWYSQVPATVDIIINVMKSAFLGTVNPLLESMAVKNNQNVVNASDTYNIYAMDWYDTHSTSQAPVDYIIGLNK